MHARYCCSSTTQTERHLCFDVLLPHLDANLNLEWSIIAENILNTSPWSHDIKV
jgi:hypothetical protein